MILVQKKRVFLTVSVDEWVVQSMAIALKEAPLTTDVVLATRKTRLSHRDPVDAFLAATAEAFDLNWLRATHACSAR